MIWKVIKHGKILQAGKYDNILSSGTDFMELVGAHEQALSALDSIDHKEVKPTRIEEEHSDIRDIEQDINGTQPEITNDDMIDTMGQLVQEEEREKGRMEIGSLSQPHKTELWYRLCC